MIYSPSGHLRCRIVVSSLEQIWTNFALHHLLTKWIACSECVPSEIKTYSQVTDTPVHQWISWESKRWILVKTKPSVKRFNFQLSTFQKSVIHSDASSSEKNPSLLVLSHQIFIKYIFFRTVFSCKWCLICAYFSPDWEETTLTMRKQYYIIKHYNTCSHSQLITYWLTLGQEHLGIAFWRSRYTFSLIVQHTGSSIFFSCLYELMQIIKLMVCMHL